MTELDRLHTVTSSYACLQGLRLAPFALPLFAVALANSRWWPIPAGGWTVALLVATFAGAFAASRLLGRYYEARFGIVVPTKAQRRSWANATALGLAVLTVAISLDLALEPPVNLFGLAFAAAMTGYWRRLGGLRPHHVVLAGLVVAVSVLPALGFTNADQTFALLVGTIGVVYLVAGLFDHQLLARTLRGRTA